MLLRRLIRLVPSYCSLSLEVAVKKTLYIPRRSPPDVAQTCLYHFIIAESLLSHPAKRIARSETAPGCCQGSNAWRSPGRERSFWREQEGDGAIQQYLRDHWIESRIRHPRHGVTAGFSDLSTSLLRVKTVLVSPLSCRLPSSLSEHRTGSVDTPCMSRVANS